MDGVQDEPFVRVRIPVAGQQLQTNNSQALRFRGGRGAAPTHRPLIDQLLEDKSLQHHAEILRGLKQSLEEEKKDFLHLQEDVFHSFAEHELMEASFDRQFETKTTLSGRLADRMAEVGGSWRFVGFFAAFILVWCMINLLAGDAAWDPYPFILLNLCLSCLAAFQAPVIMMSQNRQVARDRGQSDYTARVNLRAELITRHINCKLDALISSAWKRLFESQALSTSILERLLETEQQHIKWRREASHNAHVRARRNSKGILEELGDDEAPPSPVRRCPSQEVIEAVLCPGAMVAVYDDDSGEGERMIGVGLQKGGLGKQKQADMEAAAAEEEGRKPNTAVTTSSTTSSSSTSSTSSLVATSSLYSTPLAALSLAPPAAPALMASELPWLLETEEDAHTLYLMRTMLKAKGISPQQLQQQQYDEECMVFEHRSSNLGDNFIGVVSHVRLESRDPSLATKGVVCCCGPIGRRGATATTTTSAIPQRGRPVAASFVSAAVETASLVDTGGGAEPWFPFDLCYDLQFTEGAVLDSILAGDAILTLRNALDLPCMMAEGEIISMVLHPRGCPCSLLEAEAQHQHLHQYQQQQQTQPGGAGNGGSGGGVLEEKFLKLRSACPQAVFVSQGEVPPRFKPSLSKDREDRISQFWKRPLGRVTISYNPAPIFACVTLRAGQMSVPRSVEFLSHHHGHVGSASTTPSTAAAGAAAGAATASATTSTATGTTITVGAGGISAAMSGGAASDGGGFIAPPLKKASSASARTMASLLGLPPPGGNASNTNNSNSGLSLPTPSSSSSPFSSTSESTVSSPPPAVPAPPAVTTPSLSSSSGDRGPLTRQLSGSMSLQKILAMNRASLTDRWQAPTKQEVSEASSNETRASSSRPQKQLYVIINPSAELLCNALAWGFVQAGEERAEGAHDRGEGQRENAGISSSSSISSSNITDKEVPLRLGPRWEGVLPHNKWLQLPLRKNAGRYEIDLMVPIVGPAAVFFYSPQGRLRLRGFLRDDGSA